MRHGLVEQACLSQGDRAVALPPLRGGVGLALALHAYLDGLVHLLRPGGLAHPTSCSLWPERLDVVGRGRSAARRVLADRLAARKDLPIDPVACRTLPEVKAFREALHIDASPALALLNHPRLAVRIAALTGLEFRQQWRPGQAELVLQFARRAPEPEACAAAVAALGNLDEQVLIEGLGEFMRDPRSRCGGLPRRRCSGIPSGAAPGCPLRFVTPWAMPPFRTTDRSPAPVSHWRPRPSPTSRHGPRRRDCLAYGRR